jgi:hypothetical protein
MLDRFAYLAERLRDAEILTEPFPHIYLSDFLSETDFKAVSTAEEVALDPARDAPDLLESLERAGYEPITFPGCTTSKEDYLAWLSQEKKLSNTHEACEGQGMALRLETPVSPDVEELSDFFSSQELADLLREKFALVGDTRIEAGVQKYLHGYEISPHPDIREKALTWMLNVNPAPDAERYPFHTQYMKLTPPRSYLAPFWQHNPDVQTCWVPWDWCETTKTQPDNNSIVVFAPRWDTFHAIRAHYDHLATQRTQFYGNLWYTDRAPLRQPTFRELDLSAGALAAESPVAKAKRFAGRQLVQARQRLGR